MPGCGSVPSYKKTVSVKPYSPIGNNVRWETDRGIATLKIPLMNIKKVPGGTLPVIDPTIMDGSQSIADRTV
jgi:hypothetical protein